MNQFYLCVLYSSIGVFLLFSSMQTIPLLAIGLLSTITFYVTQKLIPIISEFMLKKNIFGYDINKKGSPEGNIKIPECIGFAGAVAFIIVAMLACILIKAWQRYQNLGDIYEQIHLAYLVTILGTILLGFADDMLDLQWRYKLIFPFFIIVPTISNYYGATSVILPNPFSEVLPLIQLGPLFLLYITLLGIYCTNTINIYAGINGLQVGQSIVAASSLLIIFGIKSFRQQGLKENYHYSIYLLLTFVATSLALLKLNQYPSKIFIGDTYCYFAGIVLCLASITSQYGITIHWLMFPQLINFLYSCPQLFGYYFCPRHRLTTYLLKQDKLQAIKDNMNLLNLSLRILGPTNQGQLCKKLLYFQIFFSLIPIIYQVIA